MRCARSSGTMGTSEFGPFGYHPVIKSVMAMASVDGMQLTVTNVITDRNSLNELGLHVPTR